MEFEKQLEEWMKLDYVLPEDLPNIELYMDQVTTFLEEQLKNTKRFEEDKIFTKTMINNYTKNHLLPPSNKKKYSRNHMILLIYIYYLKNFLSISDINNHNSSIKKSITEAFNKAANTFSDLEDSNEKEKLQQFAFITLLGYDIYLRKQMIEKMIDQLYQPVQSEKKDKKAKKKK